VQPGYPGCAEHAVFFEEEAEQWLHDCIEAEPSDTLTALRHYLSDHGQQGYLVHRMNDNALVRPLRFARLICGLICVDLRDALHIFTFT
jgi:hypothetical protein